MDWEPYVADHSRESVLDFWSRCLNGDNVLTEGEWQNANGRWGECRVCVSLLGVELGRKSCFLLLTTFHSYRVRRPVLAKAYGCVELSLTNLFSKVIRLDLAAPGLRGVLGVLVSLTKPGVAYYQLGDRTKGSHR